MQIQVDAWDPGYVSPPGDVAQRSQARVDPAVEVPVADWCPRDPDGGVAPDTVLLVDGVRRLDAHLWLTVPGEEEARPGVCASYAAGAVRCTAGGARVVASRVMRGLFTAADGAPSLKAHTTVEYTAHRVGDADTGELVNAVQNHLRGLEISLADAARTDGGDDLLIVDGPLKGRTHLPRALGYIKSHQMQYLPPELTRVVNALRPGQRTPVFTLGTGWERHSWYLRLPGADVPAAGLVRLESAPDVPIDEVVALAEAASLVLPRLASAPYKDPRAPQNLTPIAGLERRLRGLLGDQRLLQRGLRAAARG